MGSIVIDAVNHFFHPTPQTPDHAQHIYRPQVAASLSTDSIQRSGRVREVLRPYTPMSATVQRASSSHSSTHTTPPPYAGAQTGTPAQQVPQSSRQGARTPASPPLAARPAAPQHVSSSYDASMRAPTEAESSSSGTSSSRSMSVADASGTSAPQKIRVRDLAHIRSLASEGTHGMTEGVHKLWRDGTDPGSQYEISGMPIENIIEMVAGLLTKITTTNDLQHEHLHRQMPAPESSSSINPQTNSVLAFHGKNVPSITILSYLNRINKYCPTSYEVFLSLLVYFDRMTEKVNAGPMQSLRQHQQHAHRLDDSEAAMEGVSPQHPELRQTATPPLSGGFEKQEQQPGAAPGTPHSRPRAPDSPSSTLEADQLNLSHFFVVDSFNIHRLVIAGVTCASKFFSDIFYTNSRYAKVSSQPLVFHLKLTC